MTGVQAFPDGWLHEDVKKAAERVRRGFPTVNELKFQAALQMIADGKFNTSDPAQALKWTQDLAREVLTGLAQSNDQ